MHAFKKTAIIPILLFCLVAAAGVILSPSIGPAWDEPDNIYSAGQYINFFRSHFDASYLTRPDPATSFFGSTIYPQDTSIARYPPVPNYAGSLMVLIRSAFGVPVTSDSVIIAFHYVTVLFFALLVVSVYQLSLLMGIGEEVSIFAALVTFLYPALFGHGLSNLKDTAQVSLFTAAMYFFIKANVMNSYRSILTGACVWGLALATKFNAVYVPVIWSAWVVVTGRKKMIVWMVRSLCILLPVGLLITIVVWPYLWYEPIAHVSDVVAYFTSVGQGYRVFWDGVRYQVGVGISLWWYPWANILLTTPIPIFLIFIVGLFQIIHDLVRRTPLGRNRLILIFWIIIPLTRALLPNAAFYDGLRHFLEILPPFIIIAALGVSSLLRGKLRVVGRIAMIGIIAHLAIINTVFFPFSSGYYNALAQDANNRFDRDIEALSVKEGVAYVHGKYGPGTIWVPIAGHLSWYYLLPGDRYVYNAPEAQSIVLANKLSHFSNTEFYATIGDTYTLDHVITRGDAIFAWIYRRTY